MIANALTRMLRSPAEALAESLAAARRRLPIGRPAERMDGQTGIVTAIETDGWQVFVTVELPEGGAVRELCGFWTGRMSL